MKYCVTDLRQSCDDVVCHVTVLVQVEASEKEMRASWGPMSEYCYRFD